jgi:hypothetical protein
MEHLEMSVMLSDHKIHQATCNASELSRQTDTSAAIAAGGGSAVVAASIKTAEISHYRRICASALANNLPFGNYTQALINLGTGGS